VTLIASVRSVPRILTAAPALPEFGNVSTNGPRPTDRLKTVPQPYGQAALEPPAPNWLTLAAAGGRVVQKQLRNDGSGA
jgi:hypothetical protein